MLLIGKIQDVFFFGSRVISVCIGSWSVVVRLCKIWVIYVQNHNKYRENSKIHIQLVNGEAMVPYTDLEITFIPVILLLLIKRIKREFDPPCP